MTEELRLVLLSQMVVLGCGGVDLHVLQGVRLAEVSTIVAVDRQPSKLEVSLLLFVIQTIDPSIDGVVQAIDRAIDAHMADCMFVALGAKAAFGSRYPLRSKMEHHDRYRHNGPRRDGSDWMV